MAALLLICGTCAALASQARTASSASSAATLHRPFELHADGYVSSDACRSCHPGQYASWSSSYHRRMTQVATPESVVGTFEHVALGQASQYRLERRADSFFVNIAGEDGAPEQRHPITLLTGSHHMQIYWYETGSSRSLMQFGVGLSLVHLGFAATLQLRFASPTARLALASRLLHWSAVLIPAGFLLGGVVTYGGDPSVGVLLVPIGALLLWIAVACVVLAVLRDERA